MKRFLSGIIVGAIIGTVAFAATYTAEDASFKIFVNGKEFTESKAVVIDGSTYLPLRTLGNVLNVPVNWNDELHQVEIGNQAPAENNNEYSRTNPAPLNTVQTYTKNNKYSISANYSAAIRIEEVIRGESAWEKIKEANRFNSEPKEGYEYIIAKVDFSLLSSQNDSSVEANSYNFVFYSSKYEEYDRVTVVLDSELSTAVYPGGTAEGYVVGMIKKDDASPKLSYGLDYNGTNGIWFALN